MEFQGRKVFKDQLEQRDLADQLGLPAPPAVFQSHIECGILPPIKLGLYLWA